MAGCVAGSEWVGVFGNAWPQSAFAAWFFINDHGGYRMGVYSLRGRGTESPLADTAGNFIRAVPFIIAVRLVTLNNVQLSQSGILLAVLSGAVASGVGYVIWYAALRGLTATRAAIVQLSVPVLAAWGGIAFLAEDISLRLILAGAFILGGIALAITGRRKA